MPKINELYAFISFDENEDDEGVMGFQDNGQWFPMIGADMDRVHAMVEIADAISLRSGKPYKLMHFQLSGEIEIDNHGSGK